MASGNSFALTRKLQRVVHGLVTLVTLEYSTIAVSSLDQRAGHIQTSFSNSRERKFEKSEEGQKKQI